MRGAIASTISHYLSGLFVRVVTVVGARPQFVKAGVVCRAFGRHGIDECLVHTGQHFDDKMSDVFFRELDIPAPKYNLGIHSVSHGAMTGRMLEQIETVLLDEKPDWLVVYGDTNSTLAAALAAAKLHIPVAHVEAGLRSWNRAMPEEINRVLTDHVSNVLFCSSDVGAKNLQSEGITSGVHVVGDVMADASRLAREIVNDNGTHYRTAVPDGIEEGSYALLTLHRAENTDSPKRLSQIVHALNSLDLPIVFPIHPRTAAAIDQAGLRLEQHIHCVEPLGYLGMTAVLLSARLVLTDSGGLQKEAYWAHVPCITLRGETEWTETVDSGWNQLATIDNLCLTVAQCEAPATPASAYGDGFSADRLVSLLHENSAVANTTH
ncbi:MAG: UDP-N-acetylglucosamine 2-epimerase (non-hydrolyzing) [Planctomycetaceae bacterium]